MAKVTPEEMKERLSWSLEKKVDHAFGVIDQFYQTLDGKVYIGFSGGKDSTVLKFLVDKYTDMGGYDRVPSIFNNTTNEYAQILAFVKTFGESVTWLKPEMTFAQSIIKNGYPLVSKEQSQFIKEAKTTKSDKLRDIRMNGVERTAPSGRVYKSGKISEKWKYLVKEDIKITEKCCDILKKKPVKKYEKETGRYPLLGTTVDESTLRKQQYYKFGCNTFEGKRPKSKPMSIFTEQNIWDIIKKYNIPYCDIYDDATIDGVFVKGELRTGCAYCAFGEHNYAVGDTKFDRLIIREPKRYKSMMDKLGYRNALHKVGIVLPDDEKKEGDQLNMFNDEDEK